MTICSVKFNSIENTKAITGYADDFPVTDEFPLATDY